MRQLGMFAKYWEPGRVKTRLARSIGVHAACEVYSALLTAQLQRLENAADRRVVVFSPAQRRHEFQQVVGNRWCLEAQSSGDLGRRMAHHFACAFAEGADRVILIGSDSPTMPIELIDDAFTCLEQQPVVLGPTDDGGYYLIGLREDLPTLFDSIPWSSPQVWQQTVGKLEQLRTPFAQLRPWYDIDELSDLRRLDRELRLLVKRDSSWRVLADLVQQYTSQKNQDGR